MAAVYSHVQVIETFVRSNATNATEAFVLCTRHHVLDDARLGWDDPEVELCHVMCLLGDVMCLLG